MKARDESCCGQRGFEVPSPCIQLDPDLLLQKARAGGRASVGGGCRFCCHSFGFCCKNHQTRLQRTSLLLAFSPSGSLSVAFVGASVLFSDFGRSSQRVGLLQIFIHFFVGLFSFSSLHFRRTLASMDVSLFFFGLLIGLEPLLSVSD